MKKSQICQLLPHSGTMCLIDEIVSWDKEMLVAKTMSHTELKNPLNNEGSLNSIHGVEYAAQAMALHSALIKAEEITQTETETRGYLASVKNTNILQEYLFEKQDDDLIPLLIKVFVLMAGSQGFSYQFEVLKDDKVYISGKITIFLL